MKKYTVFYTWQSDTEENCNRHLIRKALDIAVQAIRQIRAWRRKL